MNKGTPAAEVPADEVMSWRPYLEKGERLLWTGRPATGLRLRRSDRLMVPGSLFVFTVTALILSASPLFGQGMASTLMRLGMIAFTAYLVVGRHIYDALERAFMRYALTDRRALILRRLVYTRLQSWPIGAFMPVEYRPGTLWHIYFASFYADVGEYQQMTRIGFEFIPDGERVKELVEQIQRDAAGANA